MLCRLCYPVVQTLLPCCAGYATLLCRLCYHVMWLCCNKVKIKLTQPNFSWSLGCAWQKLPKIVATFIYAGSQVQRTHSARTKMYRKCTGNVQNRYRICTEYVQNIYRKCTENVQKMYRKCTENVQEMYRIGTEYVQNMYRIFTENVQKMYRKCTENVQKMYRKCTENVQKMYRKCTENVQKMNRKCTEIVQKMYSEYSVNGQDVQAEGLVRRPGSKDPHRCERKFYKNKNGEDTAGLKSIFLWSLFLLIIPQPLGEKISYFNCIN
jgi:membrane-associated HD superfamily phosphohydrolase